MNYTSVLGAIAHLQATFMHGSENQHLSAIAPRHLLGLFTLTDTVDELNL